MLEKKEFWQDILEKIGIVEAPLREGLLEENFEEIIIKINQKDKEILFRKFLPFCVDKELSSLVKAGFSRSDVRKMRDSIFPENTSVFFKKPVEYGGIMDFSNLFLVKTNPFANMSNEFYIKQTTYNRDGISSDYLPPVLYYINPPGYVFIPIANPAILGNKSKNDKSTQIVSEQILLAEKDKGRER